MPFCKKSSFFENINELFKFVSEINQNIFLSNLEKKVYIEQEKTWMCSIGRLQTHLNFFWQQFFLDLLQTNLRNVFQNNFISDFEK